MNAVDGIVIVEHTTETIDTNDAVGNDEGSLANDKEPIEVEVNHDNKVITPTVVEETVGYAFAAALYPETVHVATADDNRC